MRTASLASPVPYRDTPAHDELRLAAELARLMRRAPRPQPRPQPRAKPAARRPTPPGSTREALATLLERHANPLTPSRRSALHVVPAAAAEASGLRMTSDEHASPPPLATAWAQRTRRHRARARVAEAISWSLTVTVGALLVGVAVWLLLGWPDDLGAAQRGGTPEHAAAARRPF
jgi:hypothetical protein